MSPRIIDMTEPLYDYMLEASVRETDVMRALREETAGMEFSGMQVSPDQGQFMALLVRMLGGRKALEVGTYTGYSALWVASVLPEDGLLVACDMSEEWTAVGRRHWDAAGVGHKIDLRLGPAVETLDALIDAGESGSFDFAFLDADKKEYDAYYERALTLLRPGGLIAVDNMLWSGDVADASNQSNNTNAIRRLTTKVRDDDRVASSLVAIGDGVLLAWKRPGIAAR